MLLLSVFAIQKLEILLDRDQHQQHFPTRIIGVDEQTAPTCTPRHS